MAALGKKKRTTFRILEREGALKSPEELFKRAREVRKKCSLCGWRLGRRWPAVLIITVTKKKIKIKTSIKS